jgi:hypothetical protein
MTIYTAIGAEKMIIGRITIIGADQPQAATGKKNFDGTICIVSLTYGGHRSFVSR